MPFSGLYDELRGLDDYRGGDKMPLPLIEVGQNYRYKSVTYTVYRYEPGVFLTKDSNDGNWYDAVEYGIANTGHPDEHLRFIRTKQDFQAKFIADEDAVKADNVDEEPAAETPSEEE